MDFEDIMCKELHLKYDILYIMSSLQHAQSRENCRDREHIGGHLGLGRVGGKLVGVTMRVRRMF